MKRPHKREKQQEKEKELRRLEKEKQRAESGRKGAMRAFSATQSQSDSDSDDMSDDDPQDLGAAAPASRREWEKGNNEYLEKQKQKIEKAKAHAREREEKRKRTDDQVQEISEEEEIDLEKYKDYRTWEDMTPEDFHKVMMQQSREIKELKKDRHRQNEANTAFSKVITAQGSSQRKAEEAAVLYNYELTGTPRDDSEESKRESVMWCTEEAGIPKHEVTSIGYVDVRRSYGIQTAVIKFGNKGDRTKMSRFVSQYKARNPLKYYSNGQTWEQYKIAGRYQETPDQRERRDYLNVAWQVLKEIEGEEGLKSDEGAYLNYPRSSINDKADHLPLIQFIFEEVAEGKLINPTARVFIEKGIWDSDFEVKYRGHYEKEEQEQEEREKERRTGR